MQWLKVHKEWKYRYQVLSPDSPDIHKIDWAYSREPMRDGHCYEVQMNDDMLHPQIVAMLREVPRAEVEPAGEVTPEGEGNA